MAVAVYSIMITDYN